MTADHPQKTHTAQEVPQRKQNLLKIQFNFIDCSRIILQGKLWYKSGKDFFGNKQINSHNLVITYIEAGNKASEIFAILLQILQRCNCLSIHSDF